MKYEKKTKQQLIDELVELQRHKDAFQEIAEQSADMICTTDLSGQITYWSPGAEKLLGYAGILLIVAISRAAEFIDQILNSLTSSKRLNN